MYPKHFFQVLENNRLPVDNQTVDHILIIAVLHHISSDQIYEYMKEFRRVLKPTGTIIIMEPYLCSQKPICNRFMKWYDNGEYIRNEPEYLELFQRSDYDCVILKRFRKCFLYNELFFTAVPNQKSEKVEPDKLSL